MEIAKERKGSPKRIGELLVAASAIKPDILTEALQISKRSNTPVGRVLMSIGELTERDLANALEVQALLRDSVISVDFGVRALTIAVKGCLSIDEAFKKLGWKPPSTEYVASTEFGDLLLEAGILSRMALENAMRLSQENGLPLGRCLLLSRTISSAMLVSSLTAQVLLRDGKIKRKQAIEGLKTAANKHQSLENSLEQLGVFKPSANSVRIGDLLVASGLLTDAEKVNALEVGLNEQKQIGQVLIQLGKITNQQLQDCLRLQEKVSAGNLTSKQAAEILNQATTRRVPIDLIVSERNVKLDEIARANEVIQILTTAGLISPENYAKTESVSKATSISLGEVMLNNGTIERTLLRNAVQACDLMKKNMLEEDQAVAGLRYSNKTGIELIEALKEVALLPSAKISNLTVDNSEGWLNKLFSKKTS